MSDQNVDVLCKSLDLKSVTADLIKNESPLPILCFQVFETVINLLMIWFNIN